MCYIEVKLGLYLGHVKNTSRKKLGMSVVDPGFPVGGGHQPIGGCQPLTHTLFGEKVCENERN